MELDLTAQQSARDGVQVARSARHCGHVHATERWQRLEPLAQILVEEIQDAFTPHTVYLTHLAHVAYQMTIRDEARHRQLNRHRTVPVEAILRRHQRGQRPGWGDQETQP